MVIISSKFEKVLVFLVVPDLSEGLDTLRTAFG